MKQITRQEPRLTPLGTWIRTWLIGSPVMILFLAPLYTLTSPLAGWSLDFALSQALSMGLGIPALLLTMAAVRERRMFRSLPHATSDCRILVRRRDFDDRTYEIRGDALSRADLASRDLRRANLWGIDLGGGKLRGATLQGAYLRDANLDGADLRDANLQDAELNGATLRNADLTGANLKGALIYNADLRGARYDPGTRWPLFFNPEKHGCVRW